MANRIEAIHLCLRLKIRAERRGQNTAVKRSRTLDERRQNKTCENILWWWRRSKRTRSLRPIVTLVGEKKKWVIENEFYLVQYLNWMLRPWYSNRKICIHIPYWTIFGIGKLLWKYRHLYFFELWSNSKSIIQSHFLQLKLVSDLTPCKRHSHGVCDAMCSSKNVKRLSRTQSCWKKKLFFENTMKIIIASNVPFPNSTMKLFIFMLILTRNVHELPIFGARVETERSRHKINRQSVCNLWWNRKLCHTKHQFRCLFDFFFKRQNQSLLFWLSLHIAAMFLYTFLIIK